MAGSPAVNGSDAFHTSECVLTTSQLKIYMCGFQVRPEMFRVELGAEEHEPEQAKDQHREPGRDRQERKHGRARSAWRASVGVSMI